VKVELFVSLNDSHEDMLAFTFCEKYREISATAFARAASLDSPEPISAIYFSLGYTASTLPSAW
jgi:hypothetical protein